jgi:hypothetical protein
VSEEHFGKWWPCLRKHYKRINCWLPHARRLQEGLDGLHPFRYFTLCARPMIDVYMLVRESIVPLDEETRRVKGVYFCECDREIFPEMIELIGIEEAGFLATLEDLVLFRDIPETQTLDSEDGLTGYLEQQGERLGEDVRRTVEEKRKHLQFQGLFPFDFLNLDFCDRFYGQPPDVMRIHSTIDKLLEWQRQPGKTATGAAYSVDRFVVAITCRVDLNTPADALARLKRIVRDNRNDYPAYAEALRTRPVTNLDSWATESPLDFFMSAWPKEIARLARQKSWDITVHDHAFYDRQNDAGENYTMVSLVVEFVRAPICDTYLSAVTAFLDVNERTNIPRFEPTAGDGAALLSNLREIVSLRNIQAGKFERELLPDPLAEITRLRTEGVPI